MKNYLKILSVDEYSITPKYLQLSNALLEAIENGKIVKGDVLPSINDLCYALDISRSTIERVYKVLKAKGVVNSIPGKGFYIANTDFKKPLKVLLLFNKLSGHKKIIYDWFVHTLGEYSAIDFYIYNNDFRLFKKILLEKQADDYAKYIIIPHFLDNDDRAYEIINTLPKDKLILLDKLDPSVYGNFAAVYEDFENDIYGALETLLPQLSKYGSIRILFPQSTYHSQGIIKGFVGFCLKYAFEYEIINDILEHAILEDSVYIILMEDDLVPLIKNILDKGLIIGKNVGVVSYNETAIKQIILNGITTISTDFKLMGSKTAEMVLSNSREHFAVPFSVTLRNSL